MNHSLKKIIFSLLLLSSPILSKSGFSQTFINLPSPKMVPVLQFSAAEGGSATHGKASLSEGGSATHGVASLSEGGSATHGGQDIYKLSLGHFKKEDLNRVRNEILLMATSNKIEAISQYEKIFKSMISIANAAKENNWMKKNAENALLLSENLNSKLTTTDVADVEEMILMALDYHFMKTLRVNEMSNENKIHIKAIEDFNFLKSMTVTKNDKAFLVNKEIRAMILKAVFKSVLNDFNLKTIELKDQTPESLESLNKTRTKITNLFNASEDDNLSDYLKQINE